jgi:hypothetical protein
MAIRPAQSVVMLERRLAEAEQGDPEPIELVSLLDEIARIERKWRIQLDAGSERRKPDDLGRVRRWYERVVRMIDRQLRAGVGDAMRSQLEPARQSCVDHISNLPASA